MATKLRKGSARTTLGEVRSINPRARFPLFLPDGAEVSFVPIAAGEEETANWVLHNSNT
jgi:hypothetical protein